MNRFATGLGVLLAVTLLFFSKSYSQELPQSLWVKVTYYDFHSDRSNPEFEAPHTGGVRKGMVDSTLDKDRKPVPGKSPYLNYYIKKWFRPFTPGDRTVPVYSPRAPYKSRTVPGLDGFDEYNQEVTYEGVDTLSHDTSFINFVIYDSLRFELQADGMYQFRNDNFFPLNNRGFGNEWNVHCEDSSKVGDQNYSFTMELNWKFVMREGLVFHFNGDDDVWVFINNKLALDLGGIHEATRDSIVLDEIEGLQIGKTYTLDVFYAERHSNKSQLWITSNIFAPPSNLYIYGKPGTPNTADNPPLGDYDTITEGVPFPLYGHIIDSLDQWKEEYDDLITWRVSSADGSLSNTNGSATVFTGNKGNTEVIVFASFINPENGKKSEKSIALYIIPAPKPKDFTIKLYKEPGDISILTPLGASDSAGYKEPYPVYGHVFDKDGNWVFEYDSLLQWDISPEKLGELSATKGEHTTFTSNTEKSQVLLTARLKNPLNPDEYFSCSVQLYIGSAPPPKQYVVKLYTDKDDLGTLISENDTLEIDISDTIYGRVFDTAGTHFKEFDKKLVWTADPDSKGKLEPATGSYTVFTATSFDTYVTLRATFTDPEYPDRKVRAKVVLHIKKAPDPYIIRLYDKPGDPSKLTALGKEVTVTAGKFFTVYGHIFDTNDAWMSHFDQDIKWRLTSGNSDASIDPDEGNTTTFNSKKVGKYTLRADFADPASKNRPPSKELDIIVVPDKPHSLQIVKDTLNLKEPQLVDTIRFGEDDHSTRIFAIVLDQYGNFIQYAKNAEWKSKDKDVASVSPSHGFTTEVISERKSSNHQTIIIVSQDGLVPDTVVVTSAPKKMTAILPNPFTPGKDNIIERLPKNVVDFYRNILKDLKNPSVTLISIQTDVPLVPLNPKDTLDPKASYGKVVVYDAVGNVIRRDLKLQRANPNSIYNYGVIWDGRNENNRIVGTGSYLFMITGKTKHGSQFKHSVKGGVKR